MVDFYKTTWQDMLRDKDIYEEALDLIAANQEVQYLLGEYKKLDKYEENYTSNSHKSTEGFLFGDLPVRKLVNLIILKVRDRKVRFFESPHNVITLATLTKYVCGVASKILAIDNVVRRKLFIWNNKNNSKTFCLNYLEHHADPNPASEIDDVINLRYKVLNNTELSIYGGFYDVQIVAEDIFDFDDHDNIDLANFINRCLDKSEVLVGYQYFDATGEPSRIGKRYIDLKKIIPEIKETLIFHANSYLK